MTWFAWGEELSVGIPEFDAEHRMLVGLVDELHAAWSRGVETVALVSILDRLVEQSKLHFAHEEAYLATRGFPGFEEHGAEHARLLDTLFGFQRHCHTSPGRVFDAPQLDFLRNWVWDHIRELDRQYAHTPLTQGRAAVAVEPA